MDRALTPKQRLGHWLQKRLPFSPRVTGILRFEFAVARQRWANRLFPWRLRKIAGLRKLRGVSLNVGTGGRGKEGWINLDAIGSHRDLTCTHDLRRPLPLAEGGVKRILAEHVVEHLDFSGDVPGVLREFHRVLEPGGVLRIVVPDVPRYMQAYLHGGREAWKELGFWEGLPADMESPIELVNHVFHQKGEHLFGWDFQSMELALKKAGFSKVVRQKYHESLDPELAIDQPNHAPYSLYVEAIKGE